MTNAGCCTENQTLSRRGLLRRALTAGAAGAFAGLVGEGLSTQLAFASSATYTGDVLVVVSLRGGFDGLSAVVPAGDPAYYTARPTIGVPKAQLLGTDPMFGLHPALKPLLPFWDAGTLGAVHAVGQGAPNRSHFAAMEELERAAPGTAVRTGWLDRMLGAAGASGTMSGVAVGSAPPARQLAGPAPDLSLASIDGFTMAGQRSDRPMAGTTLGLFDGVPAHLTTPARAVNDVLATTEGLKAAGYTAANGAVYPATELGKALRDVARLIKGNTGLMAACVDSGDWDMHERLGSAVAGQRMHDNLAQLATALAAFATDLGPTGLGGVTVVTLSEFGRRVAENGSKGLDHGYGNAMLLLGGGVRGRTVHGRWPGLAPANLVNGDLAVTTDYRAVVGEILQKRCGLGALTDVFPGADTTPLGLVAPR